MSVFDGGFCDSGKIIFVKYLQNDRENAVD